jgi:hypothetical protein
MKRPLLAVDGDSFAHRAYHALPKKAFRRADGGPGNALEGFTGMLLRLWQGERPRAVLVAWDTLTVPTYRHTAFSGYQAGREFEPELLEQLDLLPDFVSSAGIVCVKAPGYEADDFLGAAATGEEAAGGDALVATSDRDAFQLASKRTTILQPVRGSAPTRIGPAEVRERYGVDPEQVRTSSRFAATRRTRSPARGASARKVRRACSRSTAHSSTCLPRGVSQPRPKLYASIGSWRRSTATRPSRTCPIWSRTGARSRGAHPSSGSGGSRGSWRRPQPLSKLGFRLWPSST